MYWENGLCLTDTRSMPDLGQFLNDITDPPTHKFVANDYINAIHVPGNTQNYQLVLCFLRAMLKDTPANTHLHITCTRARYSAQECTTLENVTAPGSNVVLRNPDSTPNHNVSIVFCQVPKGYSLIRRQIQKNWFADTEMCGRYVRTKVMQNIATLLRTDGSFADMCMWDEHHEISSNYKKTVIYAWYNSTKLTSLDIFKALLCCLRLVPEFAHSPKFMDMANMFFNNDFIGLKNKYLKPSYNTWVDRHSDRLFTRLQEYAEALKRTQLRNYDGNIAEKQQQIIEALRLITRTEETIKNYQLLLDGYRVQKTQLETSPAQFDTAACVLLKNSPYMELVDVANHRMYVQFTVPMNNYTQKDVEMYYKHPEVQNRVNQHPSINWMFKKAFIEHQYTLMITHTIGIPLTDDTNWRDNCVSQAKNGLDIYPNPHILHYNCYTATTDACRRAIKKGDMVYALNLLLNSVNQIQFTDSAVVREFTCDLTGSYYTSKIWLDDDDVPHSLKELWEAHLKEEENNASDQTE